MICLFGVFERFFFTHEWPFNQIIDIFNFDYTRSNYENKTLGQKNVYKIANATLSYKNEDSAWSYKVTAQNMFNAQFKQSNRFSDYVISDTKTFILPRIIMLSIGYNL